MLSNVLHRIRRGLREADPPPSVPSNLEIIRDIKRLDEKLRELDLAALQSDDALRKEFLTFCMDFSRDLPSDPYSEEYRSKQFALYEHIAGKPYEITNEVYKFSAQSLADRPFPFSTESWQTVGNHLMGIGYLIKKMKLKPGARVLEFGPGWGNTTEYMAKMGYKVTAVDIEESFVELINERARRSNLEISAIQGDFSFIETVDDPFDAVVFFECFHHASDHLRILAGLDRAITNTGIAAFGAEPITDSFPIPWGLRLEGESLWAIRRHGWLELGFQEKYFRNTLGKLNWSLTKHVCEETPWGTVFIAQRS